MMTHTTHARAANGHRWRTMGLAIAVVASALVLLAANAEPAEAA